jgi:hypothetical protein
MMNAKRLLASMLLAGGLVQFAITPANGDALVTFDNGSEGWGAGPTDPLVGNAPPSLHAGPGLADFVIFGTSTNAAFLGDYSRWPGVEIGLQR